MADTIKMPETLRAEVSNGSPGGSVSNGIVQVQDSTITDIRRIAAPLGLKEYWYPALEAREVRNKPVGLKLLGEDLVFFRGANDQVTALWNVCPHRGASLMKGDCHYEGTITCPYHGWTFDGDGNCFAVLPEGPDSKVPGRIKARTYPTLTLKGMVFVWMGEGEPVAPEEDIPPELFDDHTMMLYSKEIWPVNWQVGLENGTDAHVAYVHRNAIRSLMFPMWPAGPVGQRHKIVKGRKVVHLPSTLSVRMPTHPMERIYFSALDATWPKHNYRGLWNWLVAPMKRRAGHLPPWGIPEEWGMGHRLPCMFRSDHKTDIYTRNCVPVTENESRQIYFKAVHASSWLGRMYESVQYHLYGRWMQVSNFSKQDMHAMIGQRYDTQEYLSTTDSEVILWRRLILQARGMMKPEEATSIAATAAERTSFQMHEEWGQEPERPEIMIKAES